MTAAGRDVAGWLGDALAREERASAEVARICGGGRWIMRVPVDEDRDSDTVIAASLADVPRLVAAVRAVEARHSDSYDVDTDSCRHCNWTWPCPTVRALSALSGRGDHTEEAGR